MFPSKLILAAALAAATGTGASEGQMTFEKRCAGCHGADKAKEGPPLRGVVGRQAGKVPGFRYSDGLTAARFRWDETTLDKWMTDPESVVPDTDMAYRLGNGADRAKIVEYLRQLK